MSDKANNNIVMLMGDDVQVLTQGWDQLIADEFDKYEDKILMVVPSDGRAKGNMKHGDEIKLWPDASHCQRHILLYTRTGPTR